MSEQETIAGDTADLLLYVADELDPGGRIAFETRLAREPALREQLDVLRKVDSRLKGASGVSAASAFVSERAMKSSLKLVREQVLVMNQSALALRRPFRIPKYAAAAGIAVAFVLGFVAWFYTTPDVGDPSGPQATNKVLPGNGRDGNGRDGNGRDGNGPAVGMAGAFLPVGFEEYADSSRKIDQELDALSILMDFNEVDSEGDGL